MVSKPFQDNLFQEVLIEPVRKGAKELFVVAGYSSPAMVVRHFEELKKFSDGIKLDLQVGMVSKDGIPRSSLTGFQSLPRQINNGSVKCRFNIGVPIHTKIYVWCDESGPTQAFAGSADYTQTSFGIGSENLRQREVCVEVDPKEAFDLVIELSGDTVAVDDPRLKDLLPIIDVSPVAFGAFMDEKSGIVLEDSDHQSVLLPLVQTTKNPGEVHNAGAGLNWGQRGNRNRNEAYIPIPSKVRQDNFFPDKGVRFQVITDDGESFIATVAQQGDKAIETPEDNSIIGTYFRRKLRIMPGDFVTTSALEQFGSTGVRLTRLTDDLYRLEFRPGMGYPSAVQDTEPT
jgi:hypothetical protein